MLFMAFLQKVCYCNFNHNNPMLFSVCRRKKIVIAVGSFIAFLQKVFLGKFKDICNGFTITIQWQRAVLGLVFLMGLRLYPFELDEINPMKLRKILFLPQTDFYKESRLPVVFTNRKERYQDFNKTVNNKKSSHSSTSYSSKNSEVFHKEKC